MGSFALVLAAGAGTRMKSRKPKVLHEMLGKPLVRWSIDAARAAGCEQVACVIGHGSDQVAPVVADTIVVKQEEQLGTGHAVMCARDAIGGFEGSVIVLNGDSPLLTPATIAAVLARREETGAGAVVLTMRLEDPTGYGRIVRDESGRVQAIVEQKDCTPEQAAIDECNSGVYCFDAQLMLGYLDRLSTDNAQGEYYLTDVLGLMRADGHDVEALVADDPTEALGVNSRRQLAQATKVMQRRINGRLMDAGVTMLDPDQVWVGPDVVVENDVELWPQTYLWGSTSVASGSVIGPNSRLTDTKVGHGSKVEETVAIEATIDDDVACGPRAYLRPGAHMCDGSKAGTHVEIKKSTVGPGSKVPHLSYVGDATIGSGVNLGAGTITCNYDGVSKWPTHIGDDVFVGSGTMLVAPATIGDGALVGAGSTITKEVPAHALSVCRGKQANFEGYAPKHWDKLRAEKAKRDAGTAGSGEAPEH